MEFIHISAVTLAVQKMDRSVDFYQRIGLELAFGGPRAAFTAFKLLNATWSKPSTLGPKPSRCLACPPAEIVASVRP